MATRLARIRRMPLRSRWLALTAALAIVGIAGSFLFRLSDREAATAADPVSSSGLNSTAASAVRVEVVKPRPASEEKKMTRPVSLEAFQSAELYSKVSGFLKVQNVDIGDKVTRNQVLAEIDDPELHIEVEQTAAAVEQAKAQVDQMQARVASARANLEAARTVVAQAKAEAESAKAQSVFKTKQHSRMNRLNEANAVEKELVDEKEHEMKAAQAAELAAQAAVASAGAHVTAAAAQVEQARADVDDAKSKVKITEAALKKAKVWVEYTKIVAPYDGVITKRNFNLGDFIRAAERGGDLPLLAVAEMDLMRCVVEVPDVYVPFADPGDPAQVEIDALPGKTFSGTVARVAHAEASQSRTMRAEIDIPNRGGKLRQGMYGTATITLQEAAKELSLPASCLAKPAVHAQAFVYVLRDGKAHLTPVEVSRSEGTQIEIASGLQADDDVVYRHTGALGDGTPLVVGRQGKLANRDVIEQAAAESDVPTKRGE